MPAIRQVNVAKNALKFTNQKGVEYIFDTTKIPLGKDFVAKLENYINTEWLPPLIDGQYQMEVHIFSVSPLVLTAYTANIGEKIPVNWWLPPNQ